MTTKAKSGNAQANESVNEVSNQVNDVKMNRYLSETKGNMYAHISHTFNAIIGECKHECGYCYMPALNKNLKPIRLEESRLKNSLGNDNFIFVGSSTDMFATDVKNEWITKVLDYCDKFNNKYLFQSKNPERFKEFIQHLVFKKSVICTTIESNRPYADCKAPTVEERVSAIETIKSDMDIEVHVTIEPIMDFDLKEMVDLIKRCNPAQVNIGAVSKGKGLTEPTKEKIDELITELNKFTKVIEKKNLKRLMKSAEILEIEQAKKTLSASLVMKAQIMEKTENGYNIKEENRKFGLVKQNRPIQDSNVNNFLKIIREGKYKDSFPIIAIEAVELIDNYNIIDLEGHPIPKEDAQEYLIVIDGQHRITAFSKLNAIRNQSHQIAIPNIRIEKRVKNVRELLADINMAGHSWNTADKICVAAISTGSKILDKVNELIKAKYTPTTAVLICIGKRITQKQLKELIVTGKINQLVSDEEEALKRADKFLTMTTSIVGNEMKLLKKRYFINGFNSFAAARTEDEAFNALGKLNKNDFDSVHEDNEFTEKLKAALQQKVA